MDCEYACYVCQSMCFTKCFADIRCSMFMTYSCMVNPKDYIYLVKSSSPFCVAGLLLPRPEGETLKHLNVTHSLVFSYHLENIFFSTPL